MRFRIGSKRLRFASPEELDLQLGIAPGAVSPFAIVNDSASHVALVLDAALMTAPLVAFHPLRNTATLTLTPDDFRRWLGSIGRGDTPVLDLDMRDAAD